MKLGKFVALVILYTFNGVATVFGLVLLVFGVTQCIHAQHTVEKLALASISPIFTLTVAGILFFVAALGWFGACKRNHPALVIYAIIMILMAICEFVACLGLYVMMERFGRDALPDYERDLKKKYEDYHREDVRKSLDKLHKYFGCCGPDEIIKINGNYPTSCCETLEKGECLEPYDKPCAKKIINFVKLKIEDSLILMICASAFELIAGSSAIILYYALKNHPGYET